MINWLYIAVSMLLGLGTPEPPEAPPEPVSVVALPQPVNVFEARQAVILSEQAQWDRMFAIAVPLPDNGLQAIPPVPPAGCSGTRIGARCVYYLNWGMIDDCYHCVEYWCDVCWPGDVNIPARTACLLRGRHACNANQPHIAPMTPDQPRAD
jgi:hypothetical protein